MFDDPANLDMSKLHMGTRTIFRLTSFILAIGDQSDLSAFLDMYELHDRLGCQWYRALLKAAGVME